MRSRDSNDSSAWTCSIRGRIRRGGSTSIRCTCKSFWIDKYPVTNAEFKKFVDATHYHPKDDLNFLRDWKDGNYPAGCGQQAGDLGVA